jgi:hypothetical protein
VSATAIPKVPTSGVGRLLRAILVNDENAIHELKPHLYENGDLAGVALVLAVRRRFSSTADVRDITRFVAAINAKLPEGAEVDRREAEAYIRIILGERDLGLNSSPEAIADMTGLLLDEVVRDLGLSPSSVDELIAEAEILYADSGAGDNRVGPNVV